MRWQIRVAQKTLAFCAKSSSHQAESQENEQ